MAGDSDSVRPVAFAGCGAHHQRLGAPIVAEAVDGLLSAANDAPPRLISFSSYGVTA